MKEIDEPLTPPQRTLHNYFLRFLILLLVLIIRLPFASAQINNSDFLQCRTTLKTCITDRWVIKKSDTGLSPIDGKNSNPYIGYRYELESTVQFEKALAAEYSKNASQRPNPISGKHSTGRVAVYEPSAQYTAVLYFIPLSKKVSLKNALKEISQNPGRPDPNTPPPTVHLTKRTRFNDVKNQEPVTDPPSIKENSSRRDLRLLKKERDKYLRYLDRNENQTKRFSSDYSILGYNKKYLVFSNDLNRDQLGSCIVQKFVLTTVSK